MAMARRGINANGKATAGSGHEQTGADWRRRGCEQTSAEWHRRGLEYWGVAKIRTCTDETGKAAEVRGEEGLRHRLAWTREEVQW